MRNKDFKRVVIYATLGLALFGGFCAPALARGRTSTPNPVPDRIRFTSTVEVHKADGSMVLAEALSEINLNADGTANGALSLRELAPGAALTAYRIFAGQAIDDTDFTFNAQRLSLPEGLVTIALRRLANPRLPAQSVTVTFQVVVDDLTGAGAFNFVTQGQVVSKPTDLPSVTDILIDRFAYINAQSQSVVVQTSRGSYTANFTNVALVFPSVGAVGWLELAAPEGSTPGSNQLFGSWQITGGQVLNARLQGKYLFLRARPLDTSESTKPQGWISVGPAPDPSKPSRVYDIVGTEVNVPLHFEAQADLTIF